MLDFRAIVRRSIQWFLPLALGAAVVYVAFGGCESRIEARRRAAAEIRAHIAELAESPDDAAASARLSEFLAGEEGDFARTYACGSVSGLGEGARPFVPSLIEALDCGDLPAEREAALSLGEIGPAACEALPALISKMKRSNNDSGWFAAEAIGKLGCQAVSAVPDLERIVANTDSEFLREGAQSSLDILRSCE